MGEKRVIGITGGVGSGKSAVLRILEQEYGAEILEEDRIAREMMEPGGASYEAVVQAFGPEIGPGWAPLSLGRRARGCS